jgi:translation initiation factor 2B subunit (eIF-2B alpha/beta/delta family)
VYAEIQVRNQVIEETQKADLDTSISKRAEERYQEKRESELILLIRDDDGMIEKLSRYQASLMNAANRVIQQLRLIKIMRGSRSLIAFE